MDELGIGGLDQISELPDHLLHHILSFMPTKDVVQTKLLSRTWRRVCSSYPNFEFNLHNYSQRLEQRGRYTKSFDNTMQRFHRDETGMQKLTIFASIQGAPELVPVVDRWIEISLEKQVQELDIRIYKYDLPPAIFASKSLHTLCLMGITMPPIFTTNTRFFSLRKLSICGVSLKEQILQDLIFKFPFIENLALLGGINPILVKKIRVSGLCNLKELTIFGWRVLEEVDIDAPSLKFFHYGGYILQQNNIKIKMGATNNVETLSITYDTTMTEQQFYDLISKFPLLKCLHVCMWNDV
ncbi:putative F-box/LRR-repeat protein At3g18150 [Corylus avellana]|uniref:putative F-box/LRR-repeat protein At3g18150 n=1 Tax=Corylus avellana TaxID=13451 RepID=UPI00286BC063|nr:putative F-box/LRR-repeat protein At3g18150 [Corylus avellana]